MTGSSQTKPDRYLASIIQGRSRLRPGSTPTEQAARFQAANEHQRELSRKVGEILVRLGVSPELYIRYLAFANRLDRRCRYYHSLTLTDEAKGLIQLATLRGLDPDVLLALTRELFRLPL